MNTMGGKESQLLTMLETNSRYVGLRAVGLGAAQSES